ncbi:hypothetical protein EJB05_00210, partial [Eragrostis curvula]
MEWTPLYIPPEDGTYKSHHVSTCHLSVINMQSALRLQAPLVEREEAVSWRAALRRVFARVDMLADLACACGEATLPRSIVIALCVSSTAVVAVLVGDRIVVANCSDSRAVLYRGPTGSPPVPLSDDHKPDRPDERARIRSLGGQVVYDVYGVPRVRGLLAMSHALGWCVNMTGGDANPTMTTGWWWVPHAGVAGCFRIDGARRALGQDGGCHLRCAPGVLHLGQRHSDALRRCLNGHGRTHMHLILAEELAAEATHLFAAPSSSSAHIRI